jgi:hypothetical protein
MPFFDSRSEVLEKGEGVGGGGIAGRRIEMFKQAPTMCFCAWSAAIPANTIYFFALKAPQEH